VLTWVVKYQYLADKYAPADDSAISKTLAQLQLPPDLQVTAADPSGVVPLPSGKQTSSKQQTAIAIRDGRRAVRGLAAIGGRVTGSTTTGISGTSSSVRLSARRVPLSTVLEQDFTVAGRESSLLCPYALQPRCKNPMMDPPNSQGASTLESDQPSTPLDAKDFTPHHSADPICAAMYAETMCSAPPSVAGSAAKCPIRYLDQHSPEEVARYFETHKHEIPRSHEVCVKRYQRNEDGIRRLDAKYGNLVSMIQGLGQKHQPMLPTEEEEDALEAERASNKRVENWAKDVSADGVENEERQQADHEETREGRFDRPLKEIRVGESPSRPWGISVPLLDEHLAQRIPEPPPAPVSIEHTPKPGGKCPFGHGAKTEGHQTSLQVESSSERTRRTDKCPFPAEQMAKDANPIGDDRVKLERPPLQGQPSFIQPPEATKVDGGRPQMVFTGPVFIGYPIEQAVALMQQWKNA
jgi:hypothetical protein